NPERSLLLLLPAFHAYARALKPLVSILRRRAAPETEKEPEEPTAVPNREIPPPPVQDTNEGRLVDALARLSETPVRRGMTPRPDIVSIGADHTLRQLRDLIRETKYSRVVVFGENLDDVVGVVDVRDIIDYDGDADLPLRPLVRTVPVVPATKRIADLL